MVATVKLFGPRTWTLDAVCKKALQRGCRHGNVPGTLVVSRSQIPFKPRPNGDASWRKLTQVDASWRKLTQVDASWRKLTQVEDLGQLATSFGQGLRLLALTCDHLHSLWSRSNLHASRRKFFTVWPPSTSQRKLSNASINLLLANKIEDSLA